MSGAEAHNDRTQPQGRRRLAFVADVEGWAFDNIARNIGKYIADQYESEIVYLRGKAYFEVATEIYSGRFDNVHFLGREFFFRQMTTPARIAGWARHIGAGPRELAAILSQPVTTTMVCDHLFLDEESVAERSLVMPALDAYATSSQRLFDEYSRRFSVPPLAVIADGVDLDLFQPTRAERHCETGRPLVVGWAGNSTWGGDLLGPDPKGFNSVVLPGIDAALSRGIAVVGHFADRNLRMRTRQEMAEYYAELDVLVVASSFEGTPNPLLEAMACGVPVITTDVGVVPELLGPKQRDLVMKVRDPNLLAELLGMLAANPELRVALAKENRERVRAWSWELQSKKWLQLFHLAEEVHERTKHLKTYLFQSVAEARLIAADVTAQTKRSERSLAALKDAQAELKALRALKAEQTNLSERIMSIEAKAAAERKRLRAKLKAKDLRIAELEAKAGGQAGLFARLTAPLRELALRRKSP